MVAHRVPRCRPLASAIPAWQTAEFETVEVGSDPDGVVQDRASQERFQINISLLGEVCRFQMGVLDMKEP